eukprot:EG_transcript_28185
MGRGGGASARHCLRCDPTVGSFLNGSEFVPVSSDAGSSSNRLCPRDSQCVRGCCHPCLLGHSCPAGTAAPTGRYHDNVCPAGHRCDGEDRRPRPCEAGLFCKEGGYVVNCTQHVEAARSATTGQSPYAGSYCEAGATAAGWYCPTPAQRLLCPAGHFCPNRTAAPLPCRFRPACPAGRWEDRPVFWLQGAGLAAVLLWLGLRRLWPRPSP